MRVTFLSCSGSSWAGVLQSIPGLNFPADLYLEGSDQHRGETHTYTHTHTNTLLVTIHKQRWRFHMWPYALHGRTCSGMLVLQFLHPPAYMRFCFYCFHVCRLVPEQSADLCCCYWWCTIQAGEGDMIHPSLPSGACGGQYIHGAIYARCTILTAWQPHDQQVLMLVLRSVTPSSRRSGHPLSGWRCLHVTLPLKMLSEGIPT